MEIIEVMQEGKDYVAVYKFPHKYLFYLIVLSYIEQNRGEEIMLLSPNVPFCIHRLQPV